LLKLPLQNSARKFLAVSVSYHLKGSTTQLSASETVHNHGSLGGVKTR